MTDLHVRPANQLETRASSRVDASQLSEVAAPSFVPSACLRLSCEELKPHVHASPQKLPTPISTVFPLQPKPPILLRSSCQHRRPWSTPQQLLQRQPSIVDSSRGLISTKQRPLVRVSSPKRSSTSSEFGPARSHVFSPTSSDPAAPLSLSAPAHISAQERAAHLQTRSVHLKS